MDYCEQEAKGDYSDSSMLLMDDLSRQRLEEKAKESRTSSGLPKCAHDGVERSATSPLGRILELFPSASEVEIKEAIDASAGDLQFAEHILMDHFGTYIVGQKRRPASLRIIIIIFFLNLGSTLLFE